MAEPDVMCQRRSVCRGARHKKTADIGGFFMPGFRRQRPDAVASLSAADGLGTGAVP